MWTGQRSCNGKDVCFVATLSSGGAPPARQTAAFIVVGAVGLSLGAAYVWVRKKRPEPHESFSASSPGKSRRRRSGKRHKTSQRIDNSSDATSDDGIIPSSEILAGSKRLPARQSFTAGQLSVDAAVGDSNTSIDNWRTWRDRGEPRGGGRLKGRGRGRRRQRRRRWLDRCGGHETYLRVEEATLLARKEARGGSGESDGWIAVDRKPRRRRAHAEAGGDSLSLSSAPTSPALRGGKFTLAATCSEDASIEPLVASAAGPAPCTRTSPTYAASAQRKAATANDAVGNGAEGVAKRKRKKKKKPEGGSSALSSGDSAAAEANETQRVAAVPANAAAELDARDAAILEVALAKSAAEAEAMRGAMSDADVTGDDQGAPPADRRNASAPAGHPSLSPVRGELIGGSCGHEWSPAECLRLRAAGDWQRVKAKRRNGKKSEAGWSEVS